MTKDQIAQQRYGKNYADCTIAEQIKVDSAFEGQQPPSGGANPSGADFVNKRGSDGLIHRYDWDPATKDYTIDRGITQAAPSPSTTIVQTPSTTPGARQVELDIDPRTGKAFEDGKVHQVLVDSDTGNFIKDLGPKPASGATSGGLSNSAIAAIEGAKPPKAGSGGVPIAASGNTQASGSAYPGTSTGSGYGSLAGVAPGQITAPSQTPQATDLIGFLQRFLLGNVPGQAHLAQQYPILAAARPSLGAGADYGATITPGTEGLTTQTPHIQGGIGSTAIGYGGALLPQLSMLGVKATGNAGTDTGTLFQAQAQRQQLIDSQNVRDEAARTGINVNAVAQRQFEQANGLSAQGNAYSPVQWIDRGNGPEAFDANGMKINTIGTGSAVGGKTTLTAAGYGRGIDPFGINPGGSAIDEYSAATGADFIANTPTHMVVGDAGAEHVVVTPAASPPAPGGYGGDPVALAQAQNAQGIPPTVGTQGYFRANQQGGPPQDYGAAALGPLSTGGRPLAGEVGGHNPGEGTAPPEQVAFKMNVDRIRALLGIRPEEKTPDWVYQLVLGAGNGGGMAPQPVPLDSAGITGLTRQLGSGVKISVPPSMAA